MYYINSGEWEVFLCVMEEVEILIIIGVMKKIAHAHNLIGMFNKQNNEKVMGYDFILYSYRHFL